MMKRYVLAIAAVFFVLLTACGASTTNLQSGANGTVAQKTTANGCPVQTIPIDPLPKAAVTATQNQSNKSITVNVNQSFEINLSANMKWSAVNVTSNLIHESAPFGWYNKSQDTCIFRFIASHPGQVTIQFNGTSLCTSTMCSQPVFLLAYKGTIQ